MSNSNDVLTNARKAKADEFYTRLSDIENELQYYTSHFKDKIVLCNCNDAKYGDFSTYFAINFNRLGLKELICTSYGDNSKVFFYHGEKIENKPLEIDKWEQYDLKENGDFRSGEMIELLKMADIVCTNPPFSLFREYVIQLMEYEKKFLIIGNPNAITCKDIFPLVKENRMWLGASTFNNGMYFYVTDDFEYSDTYKFKRELEGKKVNRVPSVCWYTNLDHSKRNTPLELNKRYNADEYPRYDNFDAINVNNVSDIPMDYNGIIGVPITFLNKYCPSQFEIVGITCKFGVPNGWDSKTNMSASVNGKNLYKRLLIKKI